MVRAMGLLPSAINARLEVAGEFASAQLHDQVAKLDGWNRVDYAGVLDRAGVAAMLGRIQAGLVVYLPDPCHLSAYPTKMFEYMAAGIPVIASNFPLWKTIVEEGGCGLTVDPLDPHAIAAAMMYILTHREEAEMMGRCGQEAVRTKYNWTREEQRLLTFYSNL